MMFAAKRLESRYVALACPVAVVVGGDDRLIDPAQSRRLKDALPRAVLREIDGHGHMVTHTATGEVVRAAELIAAWPA